MSLSALVQWECQQNGDDTFGAGFKAGASGVDYSLTAPTVAHATLTTLSVVNATTTKVSVSLTDYTVSANDIGNVAQLSVNGGAYAFYQIDAVDTSAANTWTMDRAVGTAAQTVVGKMGGAFASPGKAIASPGVAGQKVWVKGGTYTLTTSTPGAAGPVALPNFAIHVEGYTTTRGDRAGRPIISAGAVGSINMVTTQGSIVQNFVHFQVDGNSQASTVGISAVAQRGVIMDCVILNCTTGVSAGNNPSVIIRCKASTCTTGFSSGNNITSFIRCHADACTTGFTCAGGAKHIECIATDCSGIGFVTTSACPLYLNCVSEGNTGDGFSVGSNLAGVMIGCVASNNGGYGYTNVTANTTYLDFCASYLNTPSRLSGTPLGDLNPIVLSGDPWTDASTDDLRPDATTNEGALLRSIAAMGVIGQTDNKDVGAVSHADPAGGGGAVGPWGTIR